MRKHTRRLLPFTILLFLHHAIIANPFKAPLAGTVIIPASDFLDEIPKGNTITDAVCYVRPGFLIIPALY